MRANDKGTGANNETLVYDRRTGAIEAEHSFGGAGLRLLYTTVAGRLLLRLATSHSISQLYGWWQHRTPSARLIAPFIKRHDLDTTEFEQPQYPSFATFFERRLTPQSRPVDQQRKSLIAVADAKLLAFELDARSVIRAKLGSYDVKGLTGDASVARHFAGGVCLVFRLTVDDCHRYLFPADGHIRWSRTIPGVLHSVQPLAHLRYRVFHENHRVVTALHTQQFGEVMQVEVGALLVGRIYNHPVSVFNRGDEKGYFGLGGSTIILLFARDTVKLDRDIWEQSSRGVETKVRMGERIGEHSGGAEGVRTGDRKDQQSDDAEGVRMGEPLSEPPDDRAGAKPR